MTRLAGGVVALLALAVPVFAQSPAEPLQDVPRCAELFAATGLVTPGFDSKVEDLEGGCGITGIYLGHSQSRLRVEELEVFAPDLELAIRGGRQFEDARIKLRGLSFSPDLGYPIHSYLLEMQTRPTDLSLHYSWDPQSGAMVIDHLRAQGMLIGDWALSGRFSDVPDLSLARTGAVIPDFAIEELTLRFDEKNLVLGYLLLAILETLPPDEDPEPHIEAGKAELAAIVEALPEANADAVTKTALIDMIGRFPQLDGAAGTLELRPRENSLRFERFFLDTPEAVAALLADARITFTPPAP